MYYSDDQAREILSSSEDVGQVAAVLRSFQYLGPGSPSSNIPAEVSRLKLEQKSPVYEQAMMRVRQSLGQSWYWSGD